MISVFPVSKMQVLAELGRRGDDKKLREALAELDAAIIGLGGSLGTCRCLFNARNEAPA
jgi:hypothetical protein